jgi:hypothetical protein
VTGSVPVFVAAFGLMGAASLVPSICDLIDSRTREPFRPATWKAATVRDAASDDVTQGNETAPGTGERRFQERVLADRDSRGHTLH